MKKSKNLVLLISTIFLLTTFGLAVDEEGYFETGDKDKADTTVHNVSTNELDDMLASAGVDMTATELQEKMQELANDPDALQKLTDDVETKLSDHLGAPVTVVSNDTGKGSSVSSPSKNEDGTITKETNNQTTVDGTKDKYVSLTGWDKALGIYVGEEYSSEDEDYPPEGENYPPPEDEDYPPLENEEPPHVHDSNPCNITHSHSEYNNYAGPFKRNISSLSISIENKLTSYKAGDTITLVGTRIIYETIEGNGEYPLSEAKYNGSCDTTVESCPTGEHEDEKCGERLMNYIYNENYIATPHYETVVLNFKGFKISPIENLKLIEDNKYQVPNYTDNDGDGYADDWTAKFKIIEVIPNDLEPNPTTGLAEGPITPTSDPSCTQVPPIKVPFKFTPDDDDKITNGNSNKYKLTISSGEGGTASGSKSPAVPGNTYQINAYENSGYKFDAWYKLDGTKTNYTQSSYIKMPNSNLTLIAKFTKDGKTQGLSSVTDPGLTIKSVRDLRWQSYFINNNAYTGSIISVPANKDDVLLTAGAQATEGKYPSNLKMGYAVEMELDTLHVKESDNPKLYVTATFWGKDEDGKDYELKGLLDGLKYDPNTKKHQQLASHFTNFNSASHAQTFNITKTPISITNNDVEIPGIRWNFVYYLPAKILDSNDNELASNTITVKFDIQLKDSDGTVLLDYIKYLNNNKCPWTGKVFTYSTRQSLLDDIDNDLTN